MVKAINQIIPLAQGTMTGLAIRYTMNVAFTAEEGDRSKVRFHWSASSDRQLCHSWIILHCVTVTQ